MAENAVYTLKWQCNSINLGIELSPIEFNGSYSQASVYKITGFYKGKAVLFIPSVHPHQYKLKKLYTIR